MTIYDQDYMAELAIQQEYQKGVKDPAAVDQVASPTEAEEPIQETPGPTVEAEQPVAHDERTITSRLFVRN